MTDKTTHHLTMRRPDLDAVMVRNQRAQDEVQRLCTGGSWRTCIPAQETDSDVALSDALRDVGPLVAYTHAVEAERDELRAFTEQLQQELRDGAAAHEQLRSWLVALRDAGHAVWWGWKAETWGAPNWLEDEMDALRDALNDDPASNGAPATQRHAQLVELWTALEWLLKHAEHSDDADFIILEADDRPGVLASYPFYPGDDLVALSDDVLCDAGLLAQAVNALEKLKAMVENELPDRLYPDEDE